MSPDIDAADERRTVVRCLNMAPELLDHCGVCGMVGSGTSEPGIDHLLAEPSRLNDVARPRFGLDDILNGDLGW